jgi:uncharacterized protein (DUF427 family)
MGLSWQQGPLGRDPNGTFVTATAMPERLLYLEPLRRRMSIERGGDIVARSDNATLLFEPGRYPVAYFPVGDVRDGVLQATDHEATHPDLGRTRWFDAVGGEGHIAPRAAWQHLDPPRQAAVLRDAVAFGWRAMDAFYEEDERILGHAADPYHRIDIRRTSSFYLETLTITIDSEKLESVPGQTVAAHGADRNLSVDEVGGIHLIEEQTSAGPRA